MPLRTPRQPEGGPASTSAWTQVLIVILVWFCGPTALLRAQDSQQGPPTERTIRELREEAVGLESQKKLEDALVRYRTIMDRRPEDDEVRGHVARLLSWQGKLDEAIALYREILVRHPVDLDTRVALARVLSWQKQFAEAEQLYRGVMEEAPADLDAAQGLADTLLWSQRPAEALPLYEAVYRKTRDPELGQRLEAVKGEIQAAARAALGAQVVRAREQAWANRYDEAIQQYQAVLRQDPQNLDAKQGLADTLSWSRRVDEALPLYEEVYHDTQDPEVAQRIATLKSEQAATVSRATLGEQVVKARQKAWSKRYDEAILEYRAVLNQDPANLEAKQGLADTYYWSSRYADALALYQEVYAETNDAELPARIEAVRSELALSARAPVARAGAGIAIPFRDYLKLGYSHYTYTNKFPDERNVLIEAAKPLGDMTLVGRIEPLNRFGLHDTPVSGELYSPLWAGAWGYVGGSAAVNAKFVPSWSLGGELFQGLGLLSPSLRWLEASIGYKRMEFKTAGIDLLSPGLTLYTPWNVWLTEKISYVPNQGSISLSSQLTWRPQDRLQFFLSGAYGTSGERIVAVQDFTRIKSIIWQAGAIFPISERLSGEFSGYYEDRGFLYVRRGATFNLIWHW